MYYEQRRVLRGDGKDSDAEIESLMEMEQLKVNGPTTSLNNFCSHNAVTSLSLNLEACDSCLDEKQD